MHGRWFAFVTPLVFGFALFAGCSPDDEPDPQVDGNDGSVSEETSVPSEAGTIGGDFDPACKSSVGLPMTGLPTGGGTPNVVCCGGKLTDLGTDGNCGGCGIDCNFGGAGLKCQTAAGTSGKPHSYCTGCVTKGGGNATAGNAFCATGICSTTGDATGRCSPSTGTDCNEEFCSKYSAICARDGTGKGITDPNYFCEYR